MTEQHNHTHKFDGYYVDFMTDDVFYFYDLNENYLGCVTPDEPEDYNNELIIGYDMIRNKTEDGAGNTLSFEGWGE